MTRFPLILLLAASAAAQVPDFQSPWQGAITGWQNQARHPWAASPADLDNDGDLDLAVVAGPNIPGLSILSNQGNGRYAPPVIYRTTTGSLWEDVRDVATGDLDRDGDLDVVVPYAGAAGRGKALFVHRNQDNGALSPYETYLIGESPWGIALGDLDGDGWLDAAVAGYGYLGTGRTIQVALNDRAGGFLASTAVTVERAPARVKIADMNGDGLPDIVVGHDAARVSLLLNSGGAQFSVRSFTTSRASAVFVGLDVADVDQDSDLDVLCANHVLYNDGAANLGGERVLTAGPFMNSPAGITAGDWNGDGWLDIATTHLFDGEWAYYRGDGTGGFDEGIVLRAGEYALSPVTLDADGDGRDDLLILGHHSLVAALYTGGQGFAAPQTFPVGNNALPSGSNLRVVDLDGDGDRDVALALTEGAPATRGGPAFLRNDGTGNFGSATIVPSPTGAVALDIADLDNDGLPDFVWADDRAPYEVHTSLNLGNAVFAPRKNWPITGCRIGDVETLDVNSDGYLDLAVSIAVNFQPCGSFSQVPVWFLLNNGQGGFLAPFSVILGGICTDLETADLDGNGTTDLLANSGVTGCEYLLSNGDGTFLPRRQVVTDPAPTHIATGDFNNDGYVDVAIAALNAYPPLTMSVTFGMARGLFQVPQASYEGAFDIQYVYAGTLTTGDVDGDGDLDILMTNDPSRDVSLWRNRGDGTFDVNLRYGLGAIGKEIAFADVTGDGLGDVVTAVIVEAQTAGWSFGVQVLPGTGASTWRDRSLALAGARGLPILTPHGPFRTGPVPLALTEAASNAPAAWVLGASPLYLPFLGGTLVPAPDAILPLTTDAAGTAAVTLGVPFGLPKGAKLWLQSWILDGAAVQGAAASNALEATLF